jgi:hypothetical protein
LQSDAAITPPGDRRRSPGGPLTVVVAPSESGWVAECDGDLLYEGPSPIDAAHSGRGDLARRGGGVLVILDSAGRHFKRLVVDGA